MNGTVLLRYYEDLKPYDSEPWPCPYFLVCTINFHSDDTLDNAAAAAAAAGDDNDDNNDDDDDKWQPNNDMYAPGWLLGFFYTEKRW